MQMGRGGVTGADRRLQGRQQRRDLLQNADQGALGDVETLVAQRRGDPAQRTAMDVLLDQQPRTELGREPAPGDRLGHRRGGQYPGHRAPAAATVPAAAVHDPHEPHLPVDLLTRLLTKGNILGPATPADPLRGGNVVDLLDRLKIGVVPPAMTTTTRLLTTPPPAAPSGLAGGAGPASLSGGLAAGLGRGICGRLDLLRGLTKNQPRQCRDLLAQRGDLALQLDHPHPRTIGLPTPTLDVSAGTVGLTTPTLSLAPPMLGVGAPVVRVAAPVVADRGSHNHQQTRPRGPVSSTADGVSPPVRQTQPYGNTEYLPCRYLVADRMDITGARWSTDGAEAVLKLRAVRANDDFEAYWRYHLEHEQARIHNPCYANGVIPSAA
jgi:hypothetical protein